MTYTTILCNSFSINMLNTDLIKAQGEKTLRLQPLTTKQAAEYVNQGLVNGDFKNAIGHSTSDGIIRNQLQSTGVINSMIPKGKRKTVKLSGGELVIVGQYIGKRLPEGAVKPPKGSEINYWLVVI